MDKVSSLQLLLITIAKEERMKVETGTSAILACDECGKKYQAHIMTILQFSAGMLVVRLCIPCEYRLLELLSARMYDRHDEIKT